MPNGNEAEQKSRTSDSKSSVVGGILSPVEFQSAIKQFVEPGSNVTKLLMRAYFRDEREMNASILLLRWVREYKLKNDEAMLLDRIAARTSLQGLRMHPARVSPQREPPWDLSQRPSCAGLQWCQGLRPKIFSPILGLRSCLSWD